MVKLEKEIRVARAKGEEFFQGIKDEVLEKIQASPELSKWEFDVDVEYYDGTHNLVIYSSKLEEASWDCACFETIISEDRRLIAMYDTNSIFSIDEEIEFLKSEVDYWNKNKSMEEQVGIR